MKLLLPLILSFCILAFTQGFSYEDQSNWIHLGSCGGQSQSPIDIPCSQFIHKCPAKKRYDIYLNEPVIQFQETQYEDIKRHFLHNNTWLRFSNETNDYIYKSTQFHWHRPAEHSIDGKSFDLQLHIVHLHDNPKVKQYAVVSILFEVDDTLKYDVFDNSELFSREFSQTMPFPILITNKPAYHYRGSLTTPNCNQIVNFFVQKDPHKITTRNLDKFIASINEGRPNNRLKQRLGRRQVYLINNECQTVVANESHL